MRMDYYNIHKIDLYKKIFVCFTAYSEDYQLLIDMKEKYIGILPSTVQYSDLKSLCHGKYIVNMCLKPFNNFIDREVGRILTLV